jgi:hypothetical protein
MVTVTSVWQSRGAVTRQERVRLGWRDNFVTILMGLWLMVGLFVDC